MCGIYAFYNPTLADKGCYWPNAHAPLFNRLLAGVVGAAGDVVLHEYGLLAERVRVEAIFVDGAPDPELPIPRAEIAKAYNADLIYARDYEAFCEARGLIVFDPDDL
jgi:hypothetical protein